jgi:predicted MFS family arabinose efflux permease
MAGDQAHPSLRQETRADGRVDQRRAQPAERLVMTRGLTVLFAVAGGVAVGNLYWAQPLLDFIAHDLHASTASAGWLVTATQLGYAAGILLIVPLGDVLSRRWLIPAMMVCSAVALAGCALAPSFGVLLLVITVLGLTTVAGQLLTPLAGDLADDEHRGRVVGTVVSGLITGILVSRTISGLVAGAAGWRSIFAAAAAADVLFSILLYRVIPSLPPKPAWPTRPSSPRWGRWSGGSGRSAGRWCSARPRSVCSRCSGRP